MPDSQDRENGVRWAPELLEAAKAHLLARDALHNTPVDRLSAHDARFQAVEDTLAELRAAIAKAEGRSS